MPGGRCLAALALVALAAPLLGAQDASVAPTSIDRVRARLEKAPALTLRQRTPDFTVHIEKRRPLQDIFEVPPWATDPIGWQPPGVGLDLSAVFRYLAAVKRGHDEHLAREEVQRAIADFCAAQAAAGDRRPMAPMCPPAPAVR